MIVLDASALLAFLFRETGHERVKDHLGSCYLSTVNLSEVIGRFTRDNHDPQLVLKQIRATPINIVPFSANQATLTATLLPSTKALGLSLADRACLSLALSLETPVLTADSIWEKTDIGIEIITIR